MAEGNTNVPQGEAPSLPPSTARVQANLLPQQRFPVGLALAFYAGMGVVALLWRGWWDQDWPWAAPGVEAAPLWLRLGAGLAVGSAGVVLSRVWMARSERAARLSDELARMLGPMTTPVAWGLAIASGLGEEVLFRGAAQPTLGIVAASLLFAAVHYLPGPGLWIWTLYAAGAGLVLGGLFHWTGDLLAPVLAHTVLNGVNLSWLGRQNRAAAEREPSAGNAEPPTD